MTTAWSRTCCTAVVLAAAALAVPALGGDDPVKEARDTVDVFLKEDPSLSKFFSSAAGWVVFPTVGKGGLGIGGAGGSGVLFEKGEAVAKGEAVGKAKLVQVTIGFQAGGQAYSEIVFLETAAAVNDFKKGNFALAAQVSAVAAAAGASANAKYQRGVAVFTIAKGGLMYEASVGGQKFSYQAFDHPKE